MSFVPPDVTPEALEAIGKAKCAHCSRALEEHKRFEIGPFGFFGGHLFLCPTVVFAFNDLDAGTISKEQQEAALFAFNWHRPKI